MYRWHRGCERNLMLRRWRAEIAEHESWALGGRTYPNGNYAWGRWSMAPLPPIICDDSCHCYKGPGFFRKNRPFGCSCSMCKSGKLEAKWGRGNRKRNAIKFELAHTE